MTNDDVLRIVRKELSQNSQLMRRRRMVVVGAPSGGYVELAETATGDAVATGRYFAGDTLADGDVVEVYFVDGQNVVLGELA
jgi:hypothetical protein